ncbi:uncharacterized protein LOC120977182 [Bufo bufo]|uniref:uncharacterized protein LOC120977182 n=1 Tax=Bufo bufo TaxID=8384 RepID=UPI001ABE2728|nr:uncharacterized protein LOC120977182 [Bufo bufo]
MRLLSLRRRTKEPYVLGLQSHLRNSMQLVQHLQEMHLPPGTLILTCDVESLYSNISHSDGLQAIQYFFQKSAYGDPAHHTLMGTVEQCTEFVSLLNTNSLNISLTYKISDTIADFLDLRLKLDEQGIRTSLFRKETATNSLLHFNSFHPAHLRRGIPKGQFLRLRRNCTTTPDFSEASIDLTNRFRARGYPKKVIYGAFERAKTTDRLELLKSKPKPRNTQVHLITKYNNQWRDLYTILNAHWHLLLADPKLSDHVNPTPKIIARRAPNLRDKLASGGDIIE